MKKLDGAVPRKRADAQKKMGTKYSSRINNCCEEYPINREMPKALAERLEARSFDSEKILFAIGHKSDLKGIAFPIPGSTCQGRTRKRVFAKGKIAKQHLIAAIHCIERLLTPGGILVVVVHAGTERTQGNIVNTLIQAVTKRKGLFGYGIAYGQNACVKIFNRLGMEMQL